MTEDEIVELGEFVDLLLASPHFNRLTADFEQAAARDFLNTKADAKDEREKIFSTLEGARAFLGFLNEIGIQRAKILERSNQPADDTDEAADDDVIMGEDDLFDPPPL